MDRLLLNERVHVEVFQQELSPIYLRWKEIHDMNPSPYTEEATIMMELERQHKANMMVPDYSGDLNQAIKVLEYLKSIGSVTIRPTLTDVWKIQLQTSVGSDLVIDSKLGKAICMLALIYSKPMDPQAA